MGRTTTIKLTMLSDLQKKMKAMETALEPKDVNPVLVAAMDIIRRKAVDILQSLGIKELTGTLVNSLITQATKSTRLAGAWLKADAIKGTGADNARHAHLIEFGHVLWEGGVRKQGQGHQVGEVKAYPFFRPAVDQTKEEVRRFIKDGLTALLMGSTGEMDTAIAAWAASGITPTGRQRKWKPRSATRLLKRAQRAARKTLKK